VSGDGDIADAGSLRWLIKSLVENAHRQVRDILRAARLSRPSAHAAKTKHREFIRYYELLDKEFVKIGVQLASNPNIDYLQQLKSGMEALQPIRDAWSQWAEPKPADSL
jgi:hypothetical protein